MCFSSKKIKKLENEVYELKEQNAFIQELYEGEKLAKEKCWESYERCKKELKACQESPEPSPNNQAIKSLKIQNGRFIVNGKQAKLIGVSKREMLAVGSGDLPASEVDYDYDEVEEAMLDSDSNYFRFLIGKNIAWARDRIIKCLKRGKVVEVELFDAGKPGRPWQADWKDAFNALKDLPVFFDAHNEFTEHYVVNEVLAIIDYVTSHGGLIGAGAWGSSTNGKKYATELKYATDKYQIVTHHRQWTKASIDSDREPGKVLLMNELHTRDHNLSQIKQLMKDMYSWCEGVQVYSLLNFGSGEGSNFQKLLDYVGEIK